MKSMSPPNTAALTPLAFLGRAATVHPDRPAIRADGRTLTYASFAHDAQRLAKAIARRCTPGDRVAILAPNVPELLIAHFAVPLAGMTLVTINTRLTAEEVEYILEHSGAAMLIVDPSHLDTAKQALAGLPAAPELVCLDDGRNGAMSYDTLLDEGGDGAPLPWAVEDENAVIAINYTSGTTGRPKGVMYSHRGAALNALGLLHHAAFDADTRYLWTLPMFHCNGWCAPWAVVAGGGLQVCLRAVRADAVWRAIDEDGITHLCGAPTVLSLIADAPQAHPFGRRVTMIAGGAPPSPTIIARLESMGAHVRHAYGLTEVYGPYTICEHQDTWATLPVEERAARMARQGVGMVQSGQLRVVDEELVDVPADGATIGEIVMRGNTVMLGYFRDESATATAFAGGWFHSGDLGVMHPDGYLEVKDRSKDIIISGGENISSIEIENALVAHPGLVDAAVVAVADEHWGERPVAFVVARPQTAVDPVEIRRFLRERLAHYKVPERYVEVHELPRTSTGKVLKRDLRTIAEHARATG